MRPTFAVFCVLAALQAVPARATEKPTPVVGVDEVWKSVSEETGVEAAQRAQILRVLDHPATREVAESHGLDLDAARDAVNTLSGEDLQQLSVQAAAAEMGMSDKIVLTSTTLIIILLILIILLIIA